jgi:RNA polymerase sigma factor (sigma-70 family)
MPQPQHQSPTPTMLVRQALDLYESSLIAYASSIFNGDEDRARDVVQDTLLKLYLADPVRVSENLKAWLYAVCRNRAFDVLRKENRMVLSDDGEPMDWLDEWQPDPSDEAGRDELLGHVWTVLEQLPRNQREVIRLKFQHDLSYKEISNITGLSVTNVGFLLHTGVKRLRKLLQHTLSEHPSP